MHAWQHVNQVRKDLSEMRRPRSTQDEIGSVVSFLAAPSDPAVAPAGPSSQRGPSSSQRGSSPKFTPATALVVSNVRRDDTAHTPGAPKGNAATAASISGRPHQGPLLEALAVGTDLWETSIPCNLVRVRDPAPQTPPATLFGNAFVAPVLTFEYVSAPDVGSADGRGIGADDPHPTDAGR